jgi:hypothetical protein
MTYFKGPMLVLHRRSLPSRHYTVTEWEVVQQIDFDSADDHNMNFLTQFKKPVLVPAHLVAGYRHDVCTIFCRFDPQQSTVSWFSKC